tara:strand:+ start:720 stop:1190 length:471 start_codon:yes stop_codon:yes gene_type:complete
MNKKLEKIIRVDHAGEFGAQQIYSGQIQFTRDPKLKKILQKMADEEKEHLEYFEDLILKKRVRPTLMHPLWSLGGFSLGVITALLGKNYVMACTESVETVIVEHYKKQIQEIEGSDNKELKKKIEKFLKDEAKHKETGLKNLQNKSLKLKIFRKII